MTKYFEKKMTFRNVSVIDYVISLLAGLRILADFKIIDVD